MHDFRRHPEGDTTLLSSDLVLEIRRGYDRREWALELLAQLDERPKDVFPRIRLDQGIEEAAGQVRDFLKLTVDLQSQWQERVSVLAEADRAGWNTRIRNDLSAG